MREVPEEAIRGTREGTGEEAAPPHFRLTCNSESRTKTHHPKVRMNTAPLPAPLSWRSSCRRGDAFALCGASGDLLVRRRVAGVSGAMAKGLSTTIS
jgi:hypothetical protein